MYDLWVLHLYAHTNKDDNCYYCYPGLLNDPTISDSPFTLINTITLQDDRASRRGNKSLT